MNSDNHPEKLGCIVLIFLTVLFVIVFVMAISNERAKITPLVEKINFSSQKQQEYIPVDNETLLKDLETNFESAKTKYQGNKYLIAGKVASISPNGDYNIAYSNGKSSLNIICKIHNEDKSQKKYVNELKDRDITLTAFGTITYVSASTGYIMDVDRFELKTRQDGKPVIIFVNEKSR